ncbi:MAG TPA: plastocyanin/azurin family copper-binding protein [Acidimicrobiales bacterium]|nr:plastocyanin/azurin family copper-binding protein [Acidimicrobiales bacterium]
MKMMARLAALAIVVSIGACGGDSDDEAEPGEQPGPRTVVLRDIAFKPRTLSVKAGDTVTWKFDDKGIPHDVVANDQSFKSDRKDSGTFEHTFATAGTFEYSCTVHPGMNGTVKVT